jgi:hypothetical protein
MFSVLNPKGKSSLAAISIVCVDVKARFFALQAINSSSWVKAILAAYCLPTLRRYAASTALIPTLEL